MTVTVLIVIATVLISYLCFSNHELRNQLLHHPYSVQHSKQYYRWITSGFIHRDWLHLGINMFVFWQFGQAVENIFISDAFFGPVLGRVIFLLFYLLAIAFSDIPFFMKNKDNSYKASLGASGAVAAILFAYMLFYPWVKMYLWGIVPIYSIVAGILYLAYETYLHRKNQAGDSTNHSAHIYGALFGLVGLLILKPNMIPVYWQNFIDGFPF